MFENFLGFTADAELFMQQNFYGTIKRQLVSDKDEFGMMLVTLVRRHTPVATGALFDSIDYEPDHADGDNGIVRVFANPYIQIAQWGRQYDVYQEGGLLGMPTYTNEPHEMFYKALHDVDTIVNLSQKIAQKGMDRLANNTGDFT